MSTLIGSTPGKPFGAGHRLRPTALPNQGLALERRFVRGRTTDGAPLLWVERSRHTLVAGPTSWLRFDVLTVAPQCPNCGKTEPSRPSIPGELYSPKLAEKLFEKRLQRGSNANLVGIRSTMWT